MELKKHLFNTLITVFCAALTWGVRSLWDDTDTNTKNITEYRVQIKTLSDKVDKLESNQNNLPEIYVTRRELNIMLSNIESKVDSTNSEVKIMNNKFDKLIEKMYNMK